MVSVVHPVPDGVIHNYGSLTFKLPIGVSIAFFDEYLTITHNNIDIDIDRESYL